LGQVQVYRKVLLYGGGVRGPHSKPVPRRQAVVPYRAVVAVAGLGAYFSPARGAQPHKPNRAAFVQRLRFADNNRHGLFHGWGSFVIPIVCFGTLVLLGVLFLSDLTKQRQNVMPMVWLIIASCSA
jgi:hypothetical protein